MEPRLLLQWLLDRDGENSNSLAAKLKNATTQPQIHKYLSGKAKQPRHSTLEPIAKHYGIPIDALYSEDEADRVMSAFLKAPSPMLVATGSASKQPIVPAVPAQVATNNVSPELTEQCKAVMAMLATLPDDPVVRFQVLGQLAEIIAKARGSPPSHQESPAYSHAATRAA